MEFNKELCISDSHFVYRIVIVRVHRTLFRRWWQTVFILLLNVWKMLKYTCIDVSITSVLVSIDIFWTISLNLLSQLLSVSITHETADRRNVRISIIILTLYVHRKQQNGLLISATCNLMCCMYFINNSLNFVEIC